ncbi:MAG: cadmium-translocating P-type ATPase [Eubacteriaceae bacterium]|nr:cadmium-translocating P-type ATPase [Eubacteriaceae bacterium]
MRFILKELDCPNCSAAIEKAVAANPNVASSNFNFITKEFAIELNGQTDEGDFESWLTKLVHSFEPHVEVVRHVPSKAGLDSMHADGDEAGSLRSFMRKRAIEVGGFAMLAASIPASGAAKVGLLLAAYLMIGKNVLIAAARGIASGRVFDENTLMAIATLGAMAIGDFAEAVYVMAFYMIGESLSDYATERAVESIESLLKLKTPYIRIMQGGEETLLATSEAKAGDVYTVFPGEQAALDSVILSGEGYVDTKAITGESAPIYVKEGDTVYAGYIATDSALSLKALKPYENSMVAKIIYLTKEASATKAKSEMFITSFARHYTPIVVGLAALVAFVPPLFGFGALTEWIRRSLVFLVISCPCALVLSVPLGYFAGIGAASANGILIKGSDALERLAKADVFAFDKTGTLTTGSLAIKEEHADSLEQFKEYIAAAEHYSGHPIAMAIKEAYKGTYSADEVSGFKEIAGYGVIAEYKGSQVMAGTAAFIGAEGPDSAVYLSIDGQAAGYAVFGDALKEGAKESIDELKALGIEKIVLLSGDSAEKAERAAAECGIGTAYGRLSPEEKISKLASEPGNMKAYVGEGINDAPALASSGVGIAMGALGSDAAIEASDIVVMNDSLKKLPKAVRVSRHTLSVIKQNTVFIVTVKALFLLAGALGFAHIGEAIFADVGLAVLSVISVMRIPARKAFRP